MRHRTADLQEQVFEQAILNGERYKLASGAFSDVKFDFDLISQNPDKTLFNQVAAELGHLVGAVFLDCDATVTVANGANALSEPVTVAASKRQPRNTIKAIKTKKDETGAFELSVHNLEDLEGLKCVIVDDVYSHGTNSTKVANLLTQAGAHVLGAAVVLNRNANPEPHLVVDKQIPPVVSLFQRAISDSLSNDDW